MTVSAAYKLDENTYGRPKQCMLWFDVRVHTENCSENPQHTIAMLCLHAWIKSNQHAMLPSAVFFLNPLQSGTFIITGAMLIDQLSRK